MEGRQLSHWTPTLVQAQRHHHRRGSIHLPHRTRKRNKQGRQGGAPGRKSLPRLVDRCGIKWIVLCLDTTLIFIGSNCPADSVLRKSPRSVFTLMFWEATLMWVMTGFTWDQNEKGAGQWGVGRSGIITVGQCIVLCNLERRFIRLIKMIMCSEWSQRGLAYLKVSLQEMKGVGEWAVY